MIKVENFDKEVFFMCDMYIFPSTQPETVQACCKYIVDFTAAWGNNQLSENLYMWTSCTRFFCQKALARHANAPDIGFRSSLLQNVNKFGLFTHRSYSILPYSKYVTIYRVFFSVNGKDASKLC